MKKEKLQSAITACNEAFLKLKESLVLLDDKRSDEEYVGVLSDAVIKRFEVAFEYAWKLMKAAVEYQGGEAFGPRPSIQEALRYGWIDDPEYWATALDARNGSVHDYFGVSLDIYLEIVRHFIPETEKLLERIKAI